MKTMSNTTKKLYTIFTLVALLSSGMGLLADSAHSLNVPAGPSQQLLEITGSNYGAAVTTVFGRGAAIYVKLTDNARDVTLEPDVVRIPTVRSETSTGSVIQTFAGADAANSRILDLLETGPNTGIFTGSFRVDTTDVASESYTCDVTAPFTQKAHRWNASSTPAYIFGDACLKVEQNGKIVVELANTANLRRVVTWRQPNNGDLMIDGAPFPAGNMIEGYGQSISFKVVDADLNQNTGSRETYPTGDTRPGLLRVFSDSDLTGEIIPLVETGSSSDTFLGSVGFEPSLSPQLNGKVWVQNGDRVQAVYLDQNDQSGAAALRTLPALANNFDYWIFRASSDSTLTIGRNQYFGNDANQDGVYDVPMTLTLTDLDKGIGSASPDVQEVLIAAAGPNDGEPATSAFKSVPLTEVGGLSGVFMADIALAKRDCDPTGTPPVLPPACISGTKLSDPLPTGMGFGNKWLRVKHGDILYVKYSDTRNLAGQPVDHAKTSRFYELTGGAVQLGVSPTQTIMAGKTSPQNVHVIDADQNKNPNAADEITVRIRSTTDNSGIIVPLKEDGDNSGRFVGTFGFTDTGASSGFILRVTDRDQVVAEYTDNEVGAGKPAETLASNVVIWRTATDAVVNFDESYYVKRNNAAASTVDFQERPHLIVVDQDQNNPNAQDEIPIQISRAIVDIAPNQGLVTRETDTVGTASFTVVLSTAPTAPVTLGFSSGDTTEGCIVSPTPATNCGSVSLTFTTLNWNFPQSIVLRGVDDHLNDGDIEYKIISAAAISTDTRYSGLDPTDVRAINLDPDDFGLIVINDGNYTTEYGGTVQVRVRLKSAPSHNVFVPASLSVDEGNDPPGATREAAFYFMTGGDFGSTFGQLVFTPTNWNVEQVIRIVGTPDYSGRDDLNGNPITDARHDGARRFDVVLGPTASNDPRYNNLDGAAAPDVPLQNMDKDSFGFIIDRPSSVGPLDTDEYGTPTNFSVQLNRQPAESRPAQCVDPDDDGPVPEQCSPAVPAQTVTVTLRICAVAQQQTTPQACVQATGSNRGVQVNFADGAATTRELTFNSANWNQPQIVPIKGLDDERNEPNSNQGWADPEPSPLAAGISSAPPGYAQAPVSVTIRNFDNEGQFTISPGGGVLTTTERGGSAFLKVRLQSFPRAPVTVEFSLDNPAESCIVVAVLSQPVCPPTGGDVATLTFASDAVPTIVANNAKQDQYLTVIGRQSDAPTSKNYSLRMKIVSGESKYPVDNPATPAIEGPFVAFPEIFFVNFHNRPYPGTGQLFAREIGVDSGVFLFTVPTGFGAPDARGTPRFDPGPNAATFFGEFIDPVSVAGPSRTVFSGRATWMEGPEILVVRFETPQGERITTGYLPVETQGNSLRDFNAVLAFYGDFPGTLSPYLNSAGTAIQVWIGSTTCTGRGQATTGENRAGNSAQRTGASRTDNTFRWSAPVTVTRQVTSGQNCQLDTTCCDLANSFTARVGDEVKLLDQPGEVMTIRELKPETITIMDPSGALVHVDNYGNQRSNRIHVRDGPWNHDANGRDIAVLDLSQRRPLVSHVPPGEVLLVETGPDTGEFVGSFSFGDRVELGRGEFLTATSKDVAPTALPLGSVGVSVPEFSVCQASLATNSAQSVPVKFLHQGSCSGTVSPGDVRLQNYNYFYEDADHPRVGGSVVLPTDREVKLATLSGSSPAAGDYGYVDRLPPGFGPEDTIYLDLDDPSSSGTQLGYVSNGDVRLSAYDESGSSNDFAAWTIVCSDLADQGDDNCNDHDYVNQRTILPLRPGVPQAAAGTRISVGGESYYDVNRNLVYDYHDIVYLDIHNIEGGAGVASPRDYRLTNTLSLDGRIPAITPTSLDGSLTVEAARLTALPGTIQSIGRGGTYWYPAQDATFQVQQGVGVASAASIKLVDDAMAGTTVREFIRGDGVTEYRVAKGAMSPRFTIVHATITETNKAVAPGQPAMVSSTAPAPERIIDRNHDGIITCGRTDAFDVVVTIREGGDANSRCTSTEEQLEQGQIHMSCQCRVDVTYMYRAVRRDAAPANVYEYMVSGDKIVFGAPVRLNNEIRVTYKLAQLPFTATSMNTGETENFNFVVEGLSRDYTATIPVELVGVPNNKFLFVKAAGSARDKIRLVVADTVRADGLPGRGDLSHFRSSVGLVDWVAATTAQVGFFTPNFSEQSLGTAFGPTVAAQVVDPDRDTTDQPDTITAIARNGAVPQDELVILLRETGPNTGIFRGNVPVNTDPISFTDQSINLPNPPANLFLTYADPFTADNNVNVFGTNVVWRPNENGAIRVKATAEDLCCDATAGPNFGRLKPQGTGALDLRGSDKGSFFVGIDDRDANLNALAIDTALVFVTTEDDFGGELIPVLETGPNTGLFLSSAIQFETTRVANNGKVFALDDENKGDKVRVRYIDAVNAAGVRQTFEPSVPITWHRSFDGVLRFDQPVYVGGLGPTDDTASGTIRFATIYVEDGDLNLDPKKVDVSPASRVVKVGRFDATTSDLINTNSAVTTVLTETGANTGVFIARISFNRDSLSGGQDGLSDPGLPATPLAQVGVTNGDSAVLRARYVDPFDARGVPVTFNAEALWNKKGVGLVKFDKPGYNERIQKPEIMLIDADLNTVSTSIQQHTVRVSSQNHQGLQLTLSETGPNTGIFRGSLEFASPTSSEQTKLRVADQDQIEVVYTDSSPSGSRVARAVVSIGDLVSPETVLTTNPAAPDGLARPGATTFFVTDPQITLTANEAVARTTFKTSDSGAEQIYPGPFRLAATFGEGLYELTYFSLDASNNLEVAKKMRIGVDLTEPSQRVVGFTGRPAPGGAVALAWTQVAVSTDPLEFYDYVIYRDENLDTPVGNSSQPLFTDLTIQDELPHSYRVAVRDQAGHVGPLSAAVSVIPDRTVPRLFNPTVSPNTFDSRTKPATMSLSVSATDLNLVSVVAKLELPNGTVLQSMNLTRATSGGSVFSGLLSTVNITEACTCTLNFTAIDVAGNVGQLAQQYRISGPDNRTPEITITGISSIGEVLRGQPITVEITDNVGLLFVQYRVDGIEVVTVPVPAGAPKVTFTIPTANMPLGLHTIDIFADDTAVNTTGAPVANRANRTLSFNLVLSLGTEPQLPPIENLGSFFLPTTARRQADGSMLVEWTVDASLLQQTPLGFQVWRAASPFTLVANITDPGQRTFTDSTAVAGKAYRYVVTYYTSGTGRFASLAEVPGYPGSDDQVEGSGTVGGEDAGTPSWVWVILMVFAIMAVAILVAVAVAARRNARSQRQEQVLVAPPEQQPVEEAPMEDTTQWAEQPVPEGGDVQTHRLKCPECQHRFEVQGVKPIVTNCPNCGRKGILR